MNREINDPDENVGFEERDGERVREINNGSMSSCHNTGGLFSHAIGSIISSTLHSKGD